MDTDPEKNPFDTGAENPGYDETGEMNEMDRFPPTSSRRGSEDITNPYRHRTHEETSFGGDISDITPLLRYQEDREEASRILKNKFPNWNLNDSSFNVTLNSKGGVDVMLTDTRKAAPHEIIDVDGNINEREIKKSKKIQKSLGKPAEQIVKNNETERARREKKISELQENRKTATEAQKENINRNINEQQEQIDELERENEEIEGRMSLRDKIKKIFKKYGLTITAVISAVTVVISVLVSNLKKGLTTLGKKLGEGLKDVGKKLGQILPGLVGAIALFIFKTAGEAIGFLAKNAYLLILAVVIYFAEKFEKRK